MVDPVGANSFGNPRPGSLVTAVFYDFESDKPLVFQGTLELEDGVYFLRNPNMLTPRGLVRYNGIIKLDQTETEGSKPMASKTTTPARPVAEAPVLLVTDRCDRCGAQAYVRATVDTDGDKLHLHFCGHHSRQHLAALREMPNVSILDETGRLYAGDE